MAGKHLAGREGGEGAVVEAGGSCSHPSSPLPSGSRGEAGIKPQDLPHPMTYILHQGSITFKPQQKLHLSKTQDVKRDIRLHRGVLSPGQSSTPPTRAASLFQFTVLNASIFPQPKGPISTCLTSHSCLKSEHSTMTTRGPNKSRLTPAAL